MTTLTVKAGSAGVGKSTQLIQDALDNRLQLKSVFIMTPTHTAKENLVKSIDDLLKAEYQKPLAPKVKVQALENLRYSVHVLGSSYRGEEVILIDEMSMIEMTDFKALLWDTKRLPNVSITAYGDIKQLPSVNGSSFAEVLLRNNVEGDFWKWVKDAYENVDMDTLIAPANWELEPVAFQTMLKNYRLNNLGFESYNEEYIQALLDNVIDYSSDEDNDYFKPVINAVKNYNLIIAPTHERGNEVNTYVQTAFKENAIKVFPFVKELTGTKVYLNPNHSFQTKLHREYPFMKSVPENINMATMVPTAYIVTDYAQGATVDDAIYYFGDKAIPSGKVQHFYSYNRLFTSITRSRNLTQVIGNAKEVAKQLEIFPMSEQQRLEYRTADVAVKELFNRLYEMQGQLTKKEVYDLYLKVFETVTPDEDIQRELEAYNVTSVPYTVEQLTLRFKNYDTTKVITGVINYKALFYDMYISSVRSASAEKRQGKGKIQVWVNGLNTQEVRDVKKATNELSRAKFKDAYGFDKRQVIKALSA